MSSIRKQDTEETALHDQDGDTREELFEGCRRPSGLNYFLVVLCLVFFALTVILAQMVLKLNLKLDRLEERFEKYEDAFRLAHSVIITSEKSDPKKQEVKYDLNDMMRQKGKNSVELTALTNRGQALRQKRSATSVLVRSNGTRTTPSETNAGGKLDNGKRGPKKKTKLDDFMSSAYHLHMHVSMSHTEQRAPGEHVYKTWKPSSWSNCSDYNYSVDTGRLTVKKRGIYFVYGQILYHNAAARSSYAIMIGDQKLVTCWSSVDAVEGKTSDDNARYKTCYTAAATVIDAGKHVWIKDFYGNTVGLDQHSSFFGLIKLANL